MAKARLINTKQFIENLQNAARLDLKQIANELENILKSYYEDKIEGWSATYTPLNASRNFKTAEAEFWRSKFEQRQALYETAEVITMSEVDETNQTITVGAWISDGEGHINNLFYFRDLGTSTGTQENRSPFFQVPSGAQARIESGGNRTGLKAKGYSEEVAQRMRDYIESNYPGATITIQLPTHQSIEWHFDPIMKKIR